MMFAHASHDTLSDQGVRREVFGDLGRDYVDAPPVVLHGEVFEVLLDRGDGNNACLQFPRLHSLSKLATCETAEQNVVAHGFNLALTIQ